MYYFCLCKSIKELFLLPQIAHFWAKADAKVHILSIQSKFFENFFQENTKVFGIVYKYRIYTLLIYNIERLFVNLFDVILTHCLVDEGARVIALRHIEKRILIISQLRIGIDLLHVICEDR